MPNNKNYVRLTASQSFNAEEVDLIEQIFSTLLRGGDTDVLRRAPAFGSIYRKVLAMKKRVKIQHEKRLSSTDTGDANE